MLSISLFFPLQNTFAEAAEVSTAEELQNYLNSGGEIKLTDNITLTDDTYVRANLILDLNGYTLDMSDSSLIPYEASLTIEDNSSEQTGKITSTNDFTLIVGDNNKTGSLNLNSGTIDCQGAYCIYNYDNLVINGGTVNGNDYVIYNLKNFTMNGGHIISADLAVGHYAEGATTVMNGGAIETTTSTSYAVSMSRPYTSFTMNGGSITALGQNEEGTDGGNAIVAFKYTEVTINDGTLTAYSNTIMGNGSQSGNSEGTAAKFTINGGTITSIDGAGIYAPQVNGVTTVTGGTITGLTGIEIRAGTLNISGGTIIATGEYDVQPGMSGLSTRGAAVSVAQHNTAQPITVNITGGEFNGAYPISNANPLNHAQPILDLITINVEGGEYTGSDLDDVTDNIPRGYTDINTDESPTSITVTVVPTNSAGYYLSTKTSGSIDISGPNDTTATDYSEINILSNCRDGYDVVMTSTVEDNNLYHNSDDTETHLLSPIENGTSLNAVSDTWGYLLSNDTSYTPTGSDLFYAVPTFSSTPAVLRSTSSTASESDINDTFRLHFGANIGADLVSGDYKMTPDTSGTSGSILYQITANPSCTNLPIDVIFNQNDDGSGGEGTDPSIMNFPISSENTLHTDEHDVTTLTLSDKVPTRDNYRFVEWNINPNGTGTSYQPGDVITVGTGPGELSGEVTLYAIWTVGCPGGTICYDGNGADAGTMEDQTGAPGAGVALHPSNFSKAGYGFAGWNTRPDGTGINYGPIQNISIPASGGIDLFANWIPSAGSLQTWTGANSMQIGDVTALTDDRDGETYAVAKLADGNVWFIENFRLNPSTANFSLLNTNNPTTDFLANVSSSSSSNTFCKENSAGCFNTLTYNTNNLNRSLPASYVQTEEANSWYSYGTLYNWYTATAGNGTYAFDSTSGDNNDGTVSGDICPAGWHLPTGNNGEFVDYFTAIGGTTINDGKLRIYPNNFIRAGDYSGTSAGGRSVQARYWSSTASENNKAYRLGFESSSVTPNNTWNKYNGFAVRCIYDGNRIPTSEVTVNLGTHVNSVTLTNATYGTQTVTSSGDTVTMVDSLPYTISATFDNTYTIDTWTTTANGTIGTATSVNTTYTVSDSATLSISAKAATLTSYTLDYDTGASSDIIPSDTTNSYDASYVFTISNAVPYLFGHTFLGWSETSGSTTAEYSAGSTITVINSDPDNISSVTKTLYAVYEEDTCPADTICYFANGANVEGNMSDQSTSGTSATLIPSNYSRAGYGFAGWITSENATPYGPNATISLPDLSTNGLKLYAKWVASAGDLQGWAGCPSLTTGSITALTDTRDNQVYTVAKLADGKCWLTENLRINPKTATITAANTNSPTSNFLTLAPASNPTSSLCTTTGTDCEDKLQYSLNNLNRSLTQSYNTSGNSVAWYSYGGYYNWFTATAGNGLHATTGDAAGDICPNGWRLPTGGSSGEYAALNTAIGGGTTNDGVWRSYPNNFLFSGEYKGNSRSNSGSQARIWSSSAKDANNVYRMGLETNKVTATSNAYNKWDGFAIRCIINHQ